MFNFSLTLQQAAHINKAQNSVKFSQKKAKTWYDRDCDLLYRETKHLSQLLGNAPYNIKLQLPASTSMLVNLDQRGSLLVVENKRERQK